MARSRSDSGFALIEVIVSAAVLAVVALAVLSGIDGAAASSGREKARNVAASLAEADQERLRALPVTTLANYAKTSPNVVPDPAPAAPPYPVANPAGATKTVDGVNYTVLSKVEEIADDTATTASCTTSSTAAEYFHITSTVTSAIVGTRVPPQTIDSITAPNVAYSSTKGTLAVKVLNAAGAPVPGKTVSVTGGTPPPAATTNTAGCAVFQQIPTTTGGVDYTGTITGCIDQFGKSPPSGTDKVYPGRVTTITLRCDAPKTLVATAYTYAPGSTVASPSALINSAAAQYSITNSDATWTGRLGTYPPTAGAELSTQSLTNLFPFPTTYTVFTGNCHYNDPTDAGYNGVNTSGAIGALVAAQQVLATAGSVKVVQPPLNIQLQGKSPSGSNTLSSYFVILKPIPPAGDKCVQPTITTLKTIDTDATSAFKWVVGRSYSGGNLDAGVPYGTYSVCFQTTSSTYSHYSAPDYDNTTPPTGTPSTVVDSATGNWSAGKCPT